MRKLWKNYVRPCLQVSATVVTIAAGLSALEVRNSPEVVCQKIDPPVEVKDFGVASDSSVPKPGSDRSLECDGSVISWPSDEDE